MSNMDSSQQADLMDAAGPRRDADARASPRSNFYLAAVLQKAGFSASVKVRNMSATGALIEASAVPEQGADVQLIRGRLAVPATVVWSTEGRCGLRFSSLVCVAEWLAPPGNADQQRVDETVRLLRLGAVPLPQRSAPAAKAHCNAGQSIRLGEDLQRVSRLIASLGDDLAGDTDVLIRHSDKLQTLDIAIQTISAVADALAASNLDEAALARLETLRSGCAEALAVNS